MKTVNILVHTLLLLLIKFNQFYCTVCASIPLDGRTQAKVLVTMTPRIPGQTVPLTLIYKLPARLVHLN